MTVRVHGFLPLLAWGLLDLVKGAQRAHLHHTADFREVDTRDL